MRRRDAKNRFVNRWREAAENMAVQKPEFGNGETAAEKTAFR